MGGTREASLLDKLKNSPEGVGRHMTERAIVRVTKQLEEVMELKGVGRAELARRLGRSKGWVTQLLDGERNKTIRTVAYVFSVLGAQFDTSYSFPPDAKRARHEEEPSATFEIAIGLPWCSVQGIGAWSAEPEVSGLPQRFDSHVIKAAFDAT